MCKTAFLLLERESFMAFYFAGDFGVNWIFLKTHVLKAEFAMKHYFFLLLLVIALCSNAQENNLRFAEGSWIVNFNFDYDKFENNFVEYSLEELLQKIDIIKQDSTKVIPYDIASDVLFYPVNELKHSKSLMGNMFFSGYRYKINEDVWLLAYERIYDSHDYEIVWILYNSKEKIMTSKLVAFGGIRDSQTEVKKFDGEKIFLKTSYDRHFLNGFEGDNSKPVVIESNYVIKGNKFVPENK
ncbi:MAG TPA: hypothetical protein VEC36_00195 [Patescibacteria group bacterium]|nr:hypothetical protein [Patescibacteria group bacterium]